MIHDALDASLVGLQGNSRSNPEALRRRVENLLRGQVVT
jgi:hypothetical protein